MKHLILLQAGLICYATISAASAASSVGLMRGISLKQATIESNSPSILRLGAVELPATDVLLLANISIQTSCNYFNGTFTNKTVRFSVRIAEDPERKAYHELARQICEYWKDGEVLSNTKKGFLPQDREVFQSGTNYVLLVAPSNIPAAGFLLWFDGRIIQGSDPLASFFYGQAANFTIGGVPVMNGQKSLPPGKILQLFKRRTFGASNERPGVDAGWRVQFAFERPWIRAAQVKWERGGGVHSVTTDQTASRLAVVCGPHGAFEAGDEDRAIAEYRQSIGEAPNFASAMTDLDTDKFSPEIHERHFNHVLGVFGMALLMNGKVNNWSNLGR